MEDAEATIQRAIESKRKAYKDDKTDPHEVLAELLIDSGRANDARQFVADRPPLSRGSLLIEIANAQNRAGDTAGAASTIKQAEELGDKLASSEKDILLQFLSGVQAEFGDFKAATKTAGRISDASAGEYKLEAFSTIAVFEAEAGKYADGLVLSDRIKRYHSRDDILPDMLFKSTIFRMATALTNRGRSDLALSVLKSANDPADFVTQKEHNFIALYATLKSGDVNGARKFLADPKGLYLGNDTGAAGFRVFTALALQQGKKPEAVAFSESLPVGVAKAMAYIGLAQALVHPVEIPNAQYYFH